MGYEKRWKEIDQRAYNRVLFVLYTDGWAGSSLLTHIHIIVYIKHNNKYNIYNDLISCAFESRHIFYVVECVIFYSVSNSIVQKLQRRGK